MWLHNPSTIVPANKELTTLAIFVTLATVQDFKRFVCKNQVSRVGEKLLKQDYYYLTSQHTTQGTTTLLHFEHYATTVHLLQTVQVNVQHYRTIKSMVVLVR